MKKVASWLLLSLAIVPLLVTANTLIPSLGGKVIAYRGVAFVAVFLIAVIVLFLKSTRETVINRFNTICRSPLFIAMSLNAVLLIGSTIFAFDPYVAFFGEPIRGEGFLTLFAIYALYVAMVLLFQKKEWNKFFIITATSSLIVFTYQVWQAAHGIKRPGSTLGNPSFLSGYYLFIFFAGYYIFFEKFNHHRTLLRGIGVMAIITSISGIFLSETRGTIVGILLGTICSCIAAITLGRDKKIGRTSIRKASVVIVSGLIIVGSFFLVTHNQQFWQSVPGVNRIAGGNTGTLSSRIVYLDIVKDGFVASTTKQKIIGWGWDNFFFFSNKNYNPSVYVFDQSGINRAHNKLADVLIMTGILGLLSYLVIWFFFIKKVWSKIKEEFNLGVGLLFVAISYFVHNLFLFDIPVTLFYFYAVMAMVTQYTYEEK